MISKYVVYENVTKERCIDGKERYLILCPEEERHICCYECPFELRYKHTCMFVKDGTFGVVDTFDQVRKIIEEAYGE